MKVWIATIGVGGETFQIETVGVFSSEEKALEEGRRIDAKTAGAAEYELDECADWATPESLAEETYRS